MTRPDRAEAAAWAEINRRAARRAQAEARRVLTWGQTFHPWTLRRYGWELREKVGGRQVVIESGRCFTKTRAYTAWHAAYQLELNRERCPHCGRTAHGMACTGLEAEG